MIIHGDSLEVLKTLEENSIDAVVTDPPYGLKFMGKKWDYDVPSKELWEMVYMLLKPGSYLLSFGGTRTYHRMACNVEDAGFEIRDQLQWIYGTGFPKSKGHLKPAHEPILLARKPGPNYPLNIEENRIGSPHTYTPRLNSNKNMNDDNWSKIGKPQAKVTAKGRWPSNVILDEEAAELMGESARFFYMAKPSKQEREGSSHPTQKPIKLMEHLCSLITPKSGTILDPFCGSGTTCLAAKSLGFKYIGIEREEEYVTIARQRLGEV